MFSLFFLNFVAFPSRKDSIISRINANDEIIIDSVGSAGIYYGGKCHQTYPNNTLIQDEQMDWCSRVIPKHEKNIKPWIIFSVKDKAMKIKGYSIRNGCCFYDCCCTDDGKVFDGVCCCRLYSFSLHGSNDNITWKLIHKIEREKTFWRCKYFTYEFPMTEPFKYLKLVQDEQFPGCHYCLQINQVEFYGETINSDDLIEQKDDEFDDSISIIGKISKPTE